LRQQYHSYQDCIDFFKSAQEQYPDIFRVEVIGKTWEERDIIAVCITKDVEKDIEKPALFYTGTIHAREWIGIELAIAFGRYILEHIDYDPQLIASLTRSSLYLVPCANPDGFEYSRKHFSFWRKNRRQNSDGSFGVDLNRNFSVGFAPNKDTSSNVYSGPSPFSEPETLALKNFVESHPNITIALDYHSQGNVFFPAHNFIHEDAIEATDLNVLSANMAEEIRKVSGREYGVHMGKPPTHLISGSGREFYYSKGALSLVVEVGSRNISDYKKNMIENINENIPALMYALSETPNYAKEDALPRVENFIATKITSDEVYLEWEYEDNEDVYFEIYRSSKQKSYTQSANRVGMTKLRSYVDKHISSAKDYFYFIRAVSKQMYKKSPFAPVIGVRSEPEINTYSKILFPLSNKIGYVGEKTLKNKDHFGNNSLFVGISEGRGICYGVSSFSLDTIPKDAIIKDAKISFYPMNRVSVQVEKFGEWRVGLVDNESLSNIDSYDEVKDATILSYIDRPTLSHQLSQGIWRTYNFSKNDRDMLSTQLKDGIATFRMEGPKKLPIDRASQLMQWDIGYGKFSGGLTFRPKLEITYTLPKSTFELHTSNMYSVNKNEAVSNSLISGYDKDGFRQYALVEFDISNLPSSDELAISSAYLELNVKSINSKAPLRFHVELIKMPDSINYHDIELREIIERIGYDVSVSDLKNDKNQRFLFDTHAIIEIVKTLNKDEKVYFVIYATSEKPFVKNQLVSYVTDIKEKEPKVVVEYLQKPKSAPSQVSNLKHSIENGMIKLTWDNPDDDTFQGVVVAKSPFHMPCSPYDGEKLYGGRDSYTYDNFGSKDVSKYYAVFSYDEVPNFSEPIWIKYDA
jgi:carboxypeptidase T